MRIRLKLQRAGGRSQTIPINYQYELAAWIYKVIHTSSPDFSRWLHEEGYSYEKKRFKHFTFSNLKVGKRRINGDRLEILSDEIEMQIGFGIPESVHHFITGIFQNQEFSIGDRISRAHLAVSQVEQLSEPSELQSVRLRAISPICVSAGNMGKSARYLSPADNIYSNHLTQNLQSRYASIYPHKPVPEGAVRIIPRGEPRSRLVTIKAHTPQESRVRGYQFPFEVTGPAELLRLGYESGFGERGSMGFGCVEAV